jgi:hypothetical protein
VTTSAVLARQMQALSLTVHTPIVCLDEEPEALD